MITGNQYRTIEDAILYAANKVNSFGDGRVVKALVRAGYISPIDGKQGFDYVVNGSGVIAAIDYVIRGTIGAKVQPINRLVAKYVENGGVE